MTKKVLHKSSGGATIRYSETPEQRAARLSQAERDYAVRYTEAQKKALLKALLKARPTER